MPASAIALALAAAFVHAGWNVLTARAAESQVAAGVALLAGAVAFAPAALAGGSLGAEALPYVVASVALELGYLLCLATAYQRGPLSVVYPVARGAAPVLVLVGTVAFLAARPGAAQVAGVLVVAAGVVLVRGGDEPARGADLGLALLTAAFIAAYTVVDKEGLEHADALPYLEAVLAPTAVIYVAATAAIRGADAVKAEANRSTLLAGLGMFTAYGLVLAALERGSAAGVAAVRECSVVIAAGLAAAFLKEPLGRGRLAGAMLVAGGVATIALG